MLLLFTVIFAVGMIAMVLSVVAVRRPMLTIVAFGLGFFVAILAASCIILFPVR